MTKDEMTLEYGRLQLEYDRLEKARVALCRQLVELRDKIQAADEASES